MIYCNFYVDCVALHQILYAVVFIFQQKSYQIRQLSKKTKNSWYSINTIKNIIEGRINMKKVLVKLSSTFMLLALVAAQLNVNATCSHHIHQDPVPEAAKKLSKYND